MPRSLSESADHLQEKATVNPLFESCVSVKLTVPVNNFIASVMLILVVNLTESGTNSIQATGHSCEGFSRSDYLKQED